MTRTLALAVAALGLAVPPSLTAQTTSREVTQILERVGERVQAFFTRAQSLVCTETVTMQPLSSGLAADGFGRTVQSELRVTWAPADDGSAVTEAQVKRQVLKVNGRPPLEKDHRSCTTPEQTDTETQPLSMFLPTQLAKYRFTHAGVSRADQRPALLIDFREIAQVSADVQAVEGLDDCVSFDVTGGKRGRVWIDAETYDVLRLDERLSGMIDLRLPRVLMRRPGAPMYMTLERSDTSIRFERVSFSQPEESLLLPSSSSELRIMRGGGTPRLRTLTRYSDYKRFLTGSRIVG